MKKKESLKSFIYDRVLDGIIKGEYKANQILNEQELVSKYGYSKTPVREALVQLCNEGIVRNIPRFGYEVIKLTGDDVKNILDFRYILEGGSLVRIIDEIDDNQIQILTELDEICQDSSSDMWMHWDSNVKFHLAMISFSGNEYAYKQLSKSMDILKRAYAQFYWDKWNERFEPSDLRYHSKIIEQIKDRDKDGVLETLKLDLLDFAGI